MSPSRVSISTVGIVPRIKQLKRDMPFVSLALSLHAPDQELRTKIVPTAKSWNIERIMEAADAFVSNQNDQEYRKERRVKHNPNLDPDTIEDFTVAKRRKLLLEYVLLGPDVNCSKSVAHKMGELLTANEERLKNSILNVIPYNPTSAGDLQGYEPPSQQQIDEFLAIVRSYGGIVILCVTYN